MKEQIFEGEMNWLFRLFGAKPKKRYRAHFDSIKEFLSAEDKFKYDYYRLDDLTILRKTESQADDLAQYCVNFVLKDSTGEIRVIAPLCNDLRYSSEEHSDIQATREGDVINIFYTSRYKSEVCMLEGLVNKTLLEKVASGK